MDEFTFVSEGIMSDGTEYFTVLLPSGDPYEYNRTREEIIIEYHVDPHGK